MEQGTGKLLPEDSSALEAPEGAQVGIEDQRNPTKSKKGSRTRIMLVLTRDCASMLIFGLHSDRSQPCLPLPGRTAAVESPS